MATRGKRYDREGRRIDILLFMHRNYMVSGQWITVGDYARHASISTSPYIRHEFAELEALHVITSQTEPYKATWQRTYALAYEQIAIEFPDLKTALSEFGWQERLI
jgi:hypothetical protein